MEQCTPPAVESDVFYCTNHPKKETRLSCGHCEAPICTDCMVYCEVGLKCKKCVSGFKHHLMAVSPRDYVAAGLLSLAAGGVFGFLLPAVAGFGYSVIGLILCYVAGQWLGKQVHRAARYKLHRGLQALVIVASIAGLMLSPFGGIFLLEFVGIIGRFSEPGATDPIQMWDYSYLLLNMIGGAIYVFAFQHPFYRRHL